MDHEVRQTHHAVRRSGNDGWSAAAALPDNEEDAKHQSAGITGTSSTAGATLPTQRRHNVVRGDSSSAQDDRSKSREREDRSRMGEIDTEDAVVVRLSLQQRLKHVTWAWFTLVMATGGVSSTLYAVPFRFTGLWTIGVVFFLVNIVFYLLIWVMIIFRFYKYPYMFRASFMHPTESLFAPAVAVSFGTILINIVEYGFGEVGVWLNNAVQVLFWFDLTLAIILSITVYLILWSSTHFTIARMTPIWIFPAYPLLIIGPHAAHLAARIADPADALLVIVGGFTVQGIGFLVSMAVYAAFVYRLMTQKLPAEPLRPGMFVSVGPSAFTASGVIGMASNFQAIFTRLPSGQFMNVEPTLAASILGLVANWMSLWLWGLAIWFFFVSLMANIVCFRKKNRLPFAMTWFSFIFPQTALTTATFRVAEAFDAYPIKVIGCIMTVILVLVWFLVVAKMIHAIIAKQILWPEKGEDKSEGGFSMPRSEAEKALKNNGRDDSNDTMLEKGVRGTGS